MIDKTTNYADIEETLFGLIRSTDMDQGNLLVLLSLVNMMGIINIINFRAGIKKTMKSGAEAPAHASESMEGAAEDQGDQKGFPIDPAPLLSMLGGKQGSGLNPGHLEGLLKRFMGPPPGRDGGVVQEGSKSGAFSPGNEVEGSGGKKQDCP